MWSKPIMSWADFKLRVMSVIAVFFLPAATVVHILARNTDIQWPW